MCQVTTSRQRHAQNGIARLEHRQEYSLIRLCTGMRLHIDEGSAKQFLCPFNGQRFDNIDMLTPAIIAASGIAFGVFVCEDGSLRFHHRRADNVFRSNHLDLVLLANQLVTDG